MNTKLAGFSKIGVVSIAAAAALLAGTIIGMVIGSRRDGDSKSVAGPVLRSASKGSQSGIDARSSVHSKRESELDPTLENKSSTPSPSLDDLAQELLDMMSSQKPGGLSQVDRRKRLGELRPEMSEYFIRKFHEAAENDEIRQMAVELALSCGGPRAAAFLEELYTDRNDREMGHYLRIAVSVLSQGNLAPRPREFPVGESMLSLTRVLLTSNDVQDRRMATAILGFADPATAVPMLTTATTSDPDPFLRESAVRVLGRIGGEATLQDLRSNRDTLGSEMYKLYKPITSGGTVMVLSRDHFTKVIDDAIEELEERLQAK